MEQIFFNVPLSKLEPVFKRWIKEVNSELLTQTQEPEPEPDTYLTIEEAAPILRLTVPTIYRKVSQRLIPGVCKRGNRLFFSKKALLEYIQQGRRKTRAEIIDTAETYLAINK